MGFGLRRSPPRGGRNLIGGTIAAIDSLELSAADRASVYEGNARRLLRP